MKTFNFIFIFCLITLSACADVFDNKTDLKMISQNIPQMESIKCKFRQKKFLSNIQKPIISSGDFEFRKGEGVYFNTTYPVKSATNYTNKNFKEVNSIVNSISNKNYSKLERDFDFFYSGNKTEWTLGLKPKNQDTADYLSYITVEGSDYIHKISIKQTNGNITTLWFTKADL